MKLNYLRKLVLNIGLCAIVTVCACGKKGTSSAIAPPFDSIPTTRQLNPIVNEISGIADSKLNPGDLWAQEDSGNPPQIYLINHNGNVVKTIYLKGVTDRDWEDMALFNNDIYIAETGDNAQNFTDYRFYKFAEPSSSVDTVKNIETIPFNYPDGAHDAEAFLIDPATKNIYIITKRDNPSRIYRLTYPFGSTNMATFVGQLTYSGVVSGCISPDGKEIIIKTYTNIFYYKHTLNETIDQTLKKTYTNLPYTLEPQGEAVCFANDSSGFYTISEKGFASWVNIYYYKRK
jgi:hypothetical protein